MKRSSLACSTIFFCLLQIDTTYLSFLMFSVCMFYSGIYRIFIVFSQVFYVLSFLCLRFYVFFSFLIESVPAKYEEFVTTCIRFITTKSLIYGFDRIFKCIMCWTLQLKIVLSLAVIIRYNLMLLTNIFFIPEIISPIRPLYSPNKMITSFFLTSLSTMVCSSQKMLLSFLC